MQKRKNNSNGLLKTSEIAREAGVLPSTIRYYTHLGILKPAEIWISGYRLYSRQETLEKIRHIRTYLKERPTLAKLKKVLETGVEG